MGDQRASLFGVSEIWNCERAFENACPQSWSALERTGTKGVRYCNECQQNVTYSHTPEEFVTLGNAGQCVAVPDGHSPAALNTVMLGRPSTESVRKLEERKDQVASWWSSVLSCGPEFSLEEMASIQERVQHHHHRKSLIPEDNSENRAAAKEVKNAVRQGPEAVYALILKRAAETGKKLDEQFAFMVMRWFFSMTLDEFRQLAVRVHEKQADN